MLTAFILVNICRVNARCHSLPIGKLVAGDELAWLGQDVAGKRSKRGFGATPNGTLLDVLPC
jgi:hypothetical protein